MSKSTSLLPDLSPAQLRFVLNDLLLTRQVSVAAVGESLRAMTREIEQLESQLASLREVSAGTVTRTARRTTARPASTTSGRAAEAVRKRRSPHLTPARRAQLKLQGLYLALMRMIPRNKRAHFKGIRAERGLETALKEMDRAVRK